MFREVFLEIKQGYKLRAEQHRLNCEVVDLGLVKIASIEGDFYDANADSYPESINLRSCSIRIRSVEWFGSSLFSFGVGIYELLHRDSRRYEKFLLDAGEKVKGLRLDEEINRFYEEHRE